MNATDPKISASNPNSEEWKSCPPDFLSVLPHELRMPVMAIKSWVRILSNESAKELHPKALEGVSYSIEKLEAVCTGIADYYGELTRKS